MAAPDLHVVILAAGKGTRMKSARPKVLHPLAGLPILEYVLRTVQSLDAASTTVVVGHQAGDVEAAIGERPHLRFVVQSPQLGTGHALLQAEEPLRGAHGAVLLLSGDVPLLTAATLERLLELHRTRHAALTVLTTRLADPYGYGRIVRDDRDHVTRIVEERDASAEERGLNEINTGIYVFDPGPLFPALRGLADDNSQGEYYLTDLVAHFHRHNRTVAALCVDAGDELRGVNSRADLADLAKIVRARKNASLMMAGVTLDDPATTYVDIDVHVGPDTVLAPGVQLEGRTIVGERCRIHAGARITDSTVGDDVTILDRSVIVSSIIGSSARVGPFAHVRPQSVLGEGAHIGNFVELKKTTLGPGSKANHLAYLGDATIGRQVNIGAGTITCNYDGEKKHETIIEDGVFIGSDSQLIAPVVVGKGAYVAAGSSISRDVPPGALAVGRARQENKPGWVERHAANKSDKS